MLRQIRRAIVCLFGVVRPGLAATWLEKIFLTPRRHGSPNDAGTWPSSGRNTRIPYGDGGLSVWSWGEGPTVLLLHGWSGHAAQLTEFIEPLRSAGFQVVVFDAPAHGASDGERTTLVEYAEAVLQVVEAVGPIHGIVAHSFGAPAAALAAKRGLQARRVVFIGPPVSLVDASQRVAEFLGLPPKVRHLMQRRVEKRLDVPWSDLRTDIMIAQFDVPLLVFHDVLDRDVRWEDGAAIARAAKDGRLVTTWQLGHHRILRDREVVRQAVDFLAATRQQVGELADPIVVPAGEEDGFNIFANGSRAR